MNLTACSALSRSRIPLTVVLLSSTALPFSAKAQIGFIHSTGGPVVTAANSNSTWHAQHAANPTVLNFNGTYFMYFRGISNGQPSTIGVWTASASGFNGVDWNQTPANNPILTPDGSGFDATGTYDPSAVVFNGQVYMYYMGTASGSSSIGLATSSDGLNFTKQGQVWGNGGTPMPVVSAQDGKVYLFYTQGTSNGGWEYWVTSSSDGVHFGPGQRAFSPSSAAGSFDQQSTITGRIWYESPYYYMTYGGSPTCSDYPEGIGLARSQDLYSWERYPNNPVLLRGPAGGWDEAAVWSGSLQKINGQYFLWYEAAGTNAGAGSGVSSNARNNCYGDYSSNSWSQIGVATGFSGLNLSDWTPSNTIEPNTNYTLTAQHSGQCLDVYAGDRSNGGNVDQYTCLNGDPAQQWRFTNVHDGFYQISDVNAGTPGTEVLDVYGLSVQPGANVDQYQWYGSTNQQWLMVPLGNALYQIINRNSGDTLEVYGQTQATPGNVDQWPWLGLANQTWKLAPSQ